MIDRRERRRELFLQKALKCNYVLDNFILEEIKLLGNGSYGAVYHVKSLKTEEFYALKILIPSFESSENDENSNFGLKEIQILKFVQGNPHIIGIIDTYQDQSNYLAMMLMELGVSSLDKEMRLLQDGMNIYQFLQLFADLTTALNYAHHTKKITHFDMKPANVIRFHVDDRNEIPNAQKIHVYDKKTIYKLADWGSGVISYDRAERTCTMDIECFISKGYYAPELKKWNKNRDMNINRCKVDVYSLGKTLLLASGIKWDYFQHLSEILFENKHDNDLKEIFMTFNMENRYGKNLSDLIFSMIRFDPHNRPKTETILQKLEIIKTEIFEVSQVINDVYEKYLNYDREGGRYIKKLREEHEKSLQQNLSKLEFGSETLNIDKAHVLLGRYYLSRDQMKSLSYFEKGEKTQNYMAIFNMGVVNSIQSHDIARTQKVIELYQKSEELAKLQNTHCFGALNNLGVCYEKGRGVNEDIEAAVKHYEIAAEAGNSDALRNLGNLYLIKKKNKIKGKEYLEKSAAKNNERAINDFLEYCALI